MGKICRIYFEGWQMHNYGINDYNKKYFFNH